MDLNDNDGNLREGDNDNISKNDELLSDSVKEVRVLFHSVILFLLLYSISSTKSGAIHNSP